VTIEKFSSRLPVRELRVHQIDKGYAVTAYPEMRHLVNGDAVKPVRVLLANST
jgi:hypothetical protein